MYKKTSVYFTVFNLIKQGVMPKDISTRLGYSKQRLNRYLSSLKKLNYIKKVGYGTWIILMEFNKKDFEGFKKGQVKSFINSGNVYLHNYNIVNKSDIRGHAFIFRLKTPKTDLLNLKYKLNKKGKYYELLRNNGIKLIIRDKKVHIWKQSIVVYDNTSYISDKAYKCKKEAIHHFIAILPRLEKLLGYSLKIKRRYWFKVKRSHFALMNNMVAKHYNNPRKKIMIRNEQGYWFSIDNSFNLNEAEIWRNKEPKPTQDIDDTEGFKKLMNEHKNLNWEMSPKKTLEMINGVVSSQKMFDENFKSHLKILNKLSSKVDAFGKAINKFSDRLDQKKLTKYMK